MAAGIENRVYFAARDAKGQPLEISGEIVDGKGATVTRVEAVRGGLGVFSITPDAGETYRLKITGPAGIRDLPLLPPASAEQKVAIAAPHGVLAPGAPLEINILAAKERLPLVVTARLRGVLVGQRMLVTSPADRQAKGNVVSIPLEDQVTGVIRLTVYDYTKSPPKVLAERLLYRRPRRLVVHAAKEKKPGGGFSVSLSLQSEKGQPVAAALGVTVLRDGKDKLPASARRTRQDGRGAGSDGGLQSPGRCGPDLLHALLADGDLESPAAVDSVDWNLSDNETAADDTLRADGTPPASGYPVPATLLDLVLGCQKLLAGKPGDAKRARRKTPFRPPCSSITWTSCGRSMRRR